VDKQIFPDACWFPQGKEGSRIFLCCRMVFTVRATNELHEPGTRRFSMDHERPQWSPMTNRSGGASSRSGLRRATSADWYVILSFRYCYKHIRPIFVCTRLSVKFIRKFYCWSRWVSKLGPLVCFSTCGVCYAIRFDALARGTPNHNNYWFTSDDHYSAKYDPRYGTTTMI
jgi:hypothetical protein